MSQRTYFYCRVSTTEQTTANQVEAFRAKGYEVNEGFVVEETVSGAVCAMERKGFRAMVEHKLMEGDTLVVLKLDRLGRDNIDVQQTIDLLLKKGIKVHCLDLPTKDLSTSEGKLMLAMFAAFAAFEKDRIRERTIEGQARAKAQGKTIGRPSKVSPEKVAELRKGGLSISATAKQLSVSEATVKRLYATYKKQSQQ
ncbi:resolvase [Alteromonas macleodii str. 'English Channel 673']|uniref:Resolvase n=1 Tax=Alteromonas macleodii (strain English Channel 673) TaxID=1004788 RepID=A0AB32ZXD3_ALTME|nr:recombinase family protein [Alteromonas macleodii]AFT74245.1 resolvase [Alteromonas macleodii str. 'English Channel 673']